MFADYMQNKYYYKVSNKFVLLEWEISRTSGLLVCGCLILHTVEVDFPHSRIDIVEYIKNKSF